MSLQFLPEQFPPLGEALTDALDDAFPLGAAGALEDGDGFGSGPMLCDDEDHDGHPMTLVDDGEMEPGEAAKRERFIASLLKNSKVQRRRAVPLIGYIGDNGSGKSLAAVRDTLPSLERGRRVVSTCPLFDPREPVKRWRCDLCGYTRWEGVHHPRYKPLRSWREIAKLKRADLFLDEIQSVANARQSTSIPPQLMTAFLQLRKRDIPLRWTTPHWARVDSAVREVTKAAVICTSSFAQRSAGSDGWRPKRLFSARMVDAGTLDGAYTIQIGNEQVARGVRTLSREMYWRRDWWPLLYDTGAVIQVLDHVDSGGWCMDCGGSRSRPKCQCGTVHL